MVVLPRPEVFSGPFIPAAIFAVGMRLCDPAFYEVIFHNRSDFSFLVNNGSATGLAKIVTMRFGDEKPAFICVRNTGFGRHETKTSFLFV
ncbi:hypothetical protein TH3_11345 [Thalassospira xiamenensis M-5 = DSM 17429]|uniref:Uncharacterized protein n=1 Tax=Thalassospira xiamenensis M-5 = DSM 17429 TaxID=1123366 RepID=A0AB72UDM5_9PROT|nr:hypothetical protein [Thalassospira xiamenensis]AJD52385.1 hypothetical protein TH3_11345 [Thalassospira xiamenensis M-5 = DSM 17429]